MNVLLLTHRTPFPPDRGDRIRSYQLLRYLSQRARVSLACVTQEPTQTRTLAELERWCERVSVHPTSAVGRALRDVWSLGVGGSATEGHFWSPALASTIRDWNAKEPFDAVVCFCSGMYRYAEMPELRNARQVVDLVDVDSEKWAECAASGRAPVSWVHRLEARRVRRLERRIAAKADAVSVISDDEQSLFCRATGRADAVVVGNGVDTDYFCPSEAEAEQDACCFVGVLNYQPNVDGVVWFVSNVWPQVRKTRPQAVLRIVGRSPGAAISRLAKVDGVEVHADVPDVRPYLRRSSVAVAPLRISRGVQNKVIEAMAMGRPVLATHGALTGLLIQQGKDAVCADSAHRWTDELLSLFSDSERRRRIGAAAREYALRHHAWDQKLTPLGSVLENPANPLPSRSVGDDRRAAFIERDAVGV